MKRAVVAPFLAILLLLAGCRPAWKVEEVRPAYALQWPYAPRRPKVTYVRSLTGFGASSSAGALLSNLVRQRKTRDDSTFVLPVAVATGSDERMAVADMGRACVHLFVPRERRYVRLLGSRTERMRTPVAVAFDDGDRLFVSDSSGGVFEFGPDGAFLLAIHGTGPAALQRPTGLAYSSRTKLLYVVDTLAHAVHAFDASGRLVFSFGGRGNGPGRFNFPTNVTRSRSGELFVADSLNFRIQIFDEKGNFLGSFGHHGDGSGDLAMPKGVSVDADGVVYVADSLFDVVQLFDRAGRFLLTVGHRGVDFGEFWMPSGIFVDGAGRLFVCDTYNHRVQEFQITENYAEASR